MAQGIGKIIFLGVLVAGGWVGLHLYERRTADPAALLAESQASRAQIRSDVLSQLARRLDRRDRVAEALVASRSVSAGLETTTLLLQERTDDGSLLTAHELNYTGPAARLRSLTLTLGGQFAKDHPPLAGKTLELFTRLVPADPPATPRRPTTEPTRPSTTPTRALTEPAHPATEPAHPATEPARPATEPARPATEPASAGVAIDEPGRIVPVYGNGTVAISAYEHGLWADLWRLASDPAYRARQGVAAHLGESEPIAFDPARVYTVTLHPDASITVVSAPLKPAARAELRQIDEKIATPAPAGTRPFNP